MQLNGRRHTDPTSTESAPRVIVQAPQDREYALSIQDLLRVTWRRMWIIALTVAVLTGITVGFSLYQTPVYEASNKIVVGQQQSSEASVNLAGDIQGLQQLTLTVAEAADTRPIAEAVVRQLDLQESPKELLEVLYVEPVASTQFIQLSYTHESPEQAKRIVNAVGYELSDQVSDVSPTPSVITAKVWERAVTPGEPVSPNPLRNGLLALVAGIVLGLGLAFLLEHLDDSWRSPEEAERISGVPNFGVIPSFKGPKVKDGDA